MVQMVLPQAHWKAQYNRSSYFTRKHPRKHRNKALFFEHSRCDYVVDARLVAVFGTELRMLKQTTYKK